MKTIRLFSLLLIVLIAGRHASAAEKPSIVVGALRSDGAGLVYYAQDAGFFARHGIDVRIQPLNGTATVPLAVMSGSLDVGVTDLLSVALAHAKKIPQNLVFIAPSNLYTSKAPATALLVEKGSPITSAAALTGKTIAVGSLGDLSHIATEAWIDGHGGDSKSVRYIQLPFTEMDAALARHTIDAVVLNEPFLDAAKAHARVLGYPFDAIGSQFIVSGAFATSDWIAKNPDAVSRFAAALREAADWANRNRAMTAPMLAGISNIPMHVIGKMTRATYAAGLAPSLVQPVIDVAARYGVLQTAFPATEIIYDKDRAAADGASAPEKAASYR